MKIEEILSAVNGQALGPLDPKIPVAGISTDTRTLKEGDVFFALKGPRFDGHDYLEEAVLKGARHCVLSDPAAAIPNVQGVHFIRVGDTLEAYGDLAKHYRQKFKIPVVAVTGSSGKTTVKELLAHLLSSKFRVLKNRGTENNLVGVPKTIFELETSHEVLVLEMGTNRPGEIGRLTSIIAPDIGILTQIGHSHLEGLGSLEGVREEKLKLVSHLRRGGILILNGEDPNLRDVSSSAHSVLRAGLSENGRAAWADSICLAPDGTSFLWNKREPLKTRLLGEHNVVNCLLAILAATELGIGVGEIRKSLDSFMPVAGRLNIKNIDGVTFIDDTYNSNPGALKAAIEVLGRYEGRGRKIGVLGDMRELGARSEKLHREAGGWLSERSFDLVIATGIESGYLADEMLKKGSPSDRVRRAKDSEEAGRICREFVKKGDVVLVKGSRSMKMEKVFECFTTCSTP